MTTAIAFASIALTVLIAGAMHVPIHGKSLRDRLRPAAAPPTIGLRITPGTKTQLSAADIVAVVNDSPFPISWIGIYQITPESGDEIAHRYQAIARSFGVGSTPWIHVAVSINAPRDSSRGDAPQNDSSLESASHKVSPRMEVLEFLHHRLGLLGLRPRQLSALELEKTLTHSPKVVLRRPAGQNHTRRPHLWFTPRKSMDIPPAPRQIVGIGKEGKALTLRFGEFQRVVISTDESSIPSPDIATAPAYMPNSGLSPHDGHTPSFKADNFRSLPELSELILPALVIGYRVGLYTHRPMHFKELLDAGVSLVPDHRAPEVDMVIHDGLTAAANSPVRQKYVVTPTVLYLEHFANNATLQTRNDVTEKSAVNVEKRPLNTPQLKLSEHQWTLCLGEHKTGIRPIRVRPIAAPTVYSSHS